MMRWWPVLLLARQVADKLMAHDALAVQLTFIKNMMRDTVEQSWILCEAIAHLSSLRQHISYSRGRYLSVEGLGSMRASASGRPTA